MDAPPKPSMLGLVGGPPGTLIWPEVDEIAAIPAPENELEPPGADGVAVAAAAPAPPEPTVAVYVTAGSTAITEILDFPPEPPI